MKILYCIAGTFNSGGMERIVIDKANWLSRNGYSVSLVTTEQAGRGNFFSIDTNIKRIDLDILYYETIGKNIILKLISQSLKKIKHKKLLKELLYREEPDVVISTVGNEVTFLPEIKDRSKKIAEVHFSRWRRKQLNRHGIWKIIDRILDIKELRTLKKYHKFICLTNEDKCYWKGFNNVLVIPNFIPKREEERADLTKKNLIAVGRLDYQKGYDRMIEIWEKVSNLHPDWTLNIYGEGVLKSEILKLIEENNLNGKCILNKPTKDIGDKMKESSALILTSRYEGLPMVILEAMAHGLPVISFDCKCGPKDIINNGATGFVVEDGDIDGFTDRICEVIEDYNLRMNLGKKAYEESGQYTIEKIMPQWDKLFKTITIDN